MDLFVLKKIKEGDIKAFESIFRLYYTPLCLYATSITGEQEVAEEIVQDLFYVFWKERESLPILRSIKNYLLMELPGTSPYNIWSIGKYDTDTGIRF